MSNVEDQIQDLMRRYGYSRLDAIASLNLGERSDAARRASANRARRRELMRAGVSFETACIIVNLENEDE